MNGNMNAKLAYNLILQIEEADSATWWTKWIWKVSCPLKFKVFVWCCLKNKIPTWELL